MATGSLTSRGQLGSRPHTPMGRVDIRPHDDPIMLPHTLYYAPASPNLEFKSNPSTPGSERWQSLSKVGTFKKRSWYLIVSWESICIKPNAKTHLISEKWPPNRGIGKKVSKLYHVFYLTWLIQCIKKHQLEWNGPFKAQFCVNSSCLSTLSLSLSLACPCIWFCSS